MKSNGRPRPPGFYRFESFGHDDLTAKHCHFRCSRPPDVDGIKIFGKDDQAAKHQGLLVLIGLKVLVMMTSLQNIVISGAEGLPPDVDGIKIFDKDDQAAKHCSFTLNVLRPGHLYQKF